MRIYFLINLISLSLLIYHQSIFLQTNIDICVKLFIKHCYLKNIGYYLQLTKAIDLFRRKMIFDIIQEIKLQDDVIEFSNRFILSPLFTRCVET